MARYIPPHPKKGSPEAYAWAERMRKLRKQSRKRNAATLGNPNDFQYTGTLKLPPYVMSAVSQYLYEGTRGLDWTWFHVMSEADRKGFDKFLVSIQHPLAYEAGTPESRFKRFVRDYVMPYVQRANRNPGAAWHARKEREARAQDRAAKKQWQKDFFHGKATAHLESGLAARAMGMNPKQSDYWVYAKGGVWHIVKQLPPGTRGPGPFASKKDAKQWIQRLYEQSGGMSPGKSNPGRPPKRWFRSCVKQVSRRIPQVRDPKAVCGSLWHRKASPAAKASAVRRERENPIAIYGLGNPGARISAKVEGIIYNRVIEIRAEKTGYRPGLYRHPFSKASKVCLLALDNGDILVHSKAGKKLWKVDG